MALAAQSHVRALRPSALTIVTADGVRLALHRVPATMHLDTPPLPPILYLHGTCSNRRAMLGPAAFFAGHGFEGFVLETRGHGDSEPGPPGSSFDDIGEHDVAAAIGAALEETGADSCFIVGHSGGGLAALMHLARQPERVSRVRGIVTLASQATDAAIRKRRRALVLAAAAVTRALGYFPGKAIGVGPEDELAGVMQQWFRWNWERRWRGRDGFDYLAALAAIDAPLLALAAPRDRAIAPTEGCQRIVDAYGSPDKKLLLCGTSSGLTRDFDHADLVQAKHARAELWPLVARWLLERALPVQQSVERCDEPAQRGVA